MLSRSQRRANKTVPIKPLAHPSISFAQNEPGFRSLWRICFPWMYFKDIIAWVNQRKTSSSGILWFLRRVRRICFASSPPSQKSMIKQWIPSSRDITRLNTEHVNQGDIHEACQKLICSSVALGYFPCLPQKNTSIDHVIYRNHIPTTVKDEGQTHILTSLWDWKHVVMIILFAWGVPGTCVYACRAKSESKTCNFSPSICAKTVTVPDDIGVMQRC